MYRIWFDTWYMPKTNTLVNAASAQAAINILLCRTEVEWGKEIADEIRIISCQKVK